jgi:hypothetical protein
VVRVDNSDHADKIHSQSLPSMLEYYKKGRGKETPDGRIDLHRGEIILVHIDLYSFRLGKNVSTTLVDELSHEFILRMHYRVVPAKQNPHKQ